MARNEVKWGAVLSYALIIINALYGLLITPFIISSIGEVEYGVYKTISSLSASLMVLDLGLGGTVMRYIAKYKTDEKHNKIESFLSMVFAEGLVLIGVIVVVCGVLYSLLPMIYANGLGHQELVLGKQLFLVLTLNLMLHIFENLLGGIISGNNHFTFANGMKLMRIVLRVLFTYMFLMLFPNALVLVLIDLSLTVILVIAEYIYIRCVLHTKLYLRFRGWDKAVFGESFRYTLLLFLTSIVAQVNNNLDNVVIGSIQGPSFVTLYSMGLLIFGMFEHLSTAISGVMLPTITKVLAQENGLQKVQNNIIQAGRVQFALLGAALVAFAAIGQDFVKLWLGEGYEDVYIITLILMIPSILELCVNVCLSVLRAKNMLGFRTMVIFCSTVLNAVVTIAGVYYYGYIAAAFGTALSFIIGSLIVMNIYYYKKFSMPMLQIYRKIFHGTWLCLLVAGVAVFTSSRLLPGDTWWTFLLNAGVFCVAYAVMMLLFGLNKQEKQSIPILKNIWK